MTLMDRKQIKKQGDGNISMICKILKYRAFNLSQSPQSSLRTQKNPDSLSVKMKTTRLLILSVSSLRSELRVEDCERPKNPRS